LGADDLHNLQAYGQTSNVKPILTIVELSLALIYLILTERHSNPIKQPHGKFSLELVVEVVDSFATFPAVLAKIVGNPAKSWGNQTLQSPDHVVYLSYTASEVFYLPSPFPNLFPK
jgi:hypothetical protein